MGGFYYNSNGFAFHRIEDVVRIIAELGFAGLALTPDVHHLDPFRTSAIERRAFRTLLDSHELKVVIETGARFVLDPERKHWPTLLDEPADAERRSALLRSSVDLAVDLGAPVISLWSGVLPAGLEHGTAFERLVRGLRAVCEYAAPRGVRVALEPEPGMLVARADQWPDVRAAVDHPALGLTLDVGHCLANQEGVPEEAIRRHAADLLVLHLDDHRPGVHDHLMFGDGEVDFTAIARAVDEVGFSGALEVELSRHSASAPTTAEAALAFLRACFGA